MSKLAVHENKIYSLGDNAVYTIPTAILPLPTLWLRADAGIVKDGDDKVSQWQDQSGNNYHAEQETQANKPLLVSDDLNGKPVLRFDGANDFMQVDFQQSFAQPNTYFIVGRVAASSGAPHPFVGGNPGQIVSTLDSQTMGYYSGSWRTYTKPSPFDYHAFTAIFDGNNSQFYENGLLKLTTNPGANAQSQIMFIGRYIASSTEYLNGDIAEIIFYNSLLSDPQRQSVENYLINKYGL